MKDINEYVIGDEEFDLICKYIKIRYESKMSQRDLAKKTHLSNATINRYITDSRIPNAQNIKIICQTLDVSADWLLGIGEDF